MRSPIEITPSEHNPFTGTLVVAPLTLLYGYNQSGKSRILYRLPEWTQHHVMDEPLWSAPSSLSEIRYLFDKIGSDPRKLGYSSLIIQHPDACLHPDTQVDVMRQLIGISRSTVIILESHSVCMLRTLQLAVLERNISSDDVALHWVERTPDGISRVRPVPVRSDGTLDGWPLGALETEQRLARSIMERRFRATKGRSS